MSADDIIPVIGIPVYNRVDLLLRLLRSIDFPVAEVVIVNNGSIPHLMNLIVREFFGAPDVFDLAIHEPNANIGVAGAWNHLLHRDCDDYVLIVNNDIEFAPGDLRKMHECVRSNPDLHAVFGNWSYSNFIITRKGRDYLGYFDENFWPAYLEDGDHWRRIILSQANICHALGVNSRHGEEENPGSCTIKSDPELAQRNGETHARNWEYYRRKWGFVDEKMRETYMMPFNVGDEVDILKLNDWQLQQSRLAEPHYFTGSTTNLAAAT
jgi:glycosyltransferase involved in cell wall biosynthesis